MFRPTNRRVRRTAATAVILALGVGLVPPIASAAGLGGRATGGGAVATGTWGATASVTSMTFTSNTAQTTTVANTGSVALGAESYSVTLTKPFFFTPTVSLFECPVPWERGACPGGTGTRIGGTLVAPTTTTITSTTPLAVGSSTYLQVEPTGVFFLPMTVTLTPEVTSPAQLRAPIRTNR